MMENLKPCPFCGGEAELKDTGINDAIFYIRCPKCGVSTRAFCDEVLHTNPEQRISGAEIAKIVWNRRVDGKPEDDNIIEIKIDGEAIRNIVQSQWTKPTKAGEVGK